jgi:hypothetical protein
MMKLHIACAASKKEVSSRMLQGMSREEALHQVFEDKVGERVEYYLNKGKLSKAIRVVEVAHVAAGRPC